MFLYPPDQTRIKLDKTRAFQISFSPEMETIRLSSSLLTLSTTRTLQFLGFTAPSRIKTNTILRYGSGHISIVRSLSSDTTGGTVSARPSSELKKKNKNPDGEGEDVKLHALRETFLRPAVGIDAYIIPSEDAHQVSLILTSDIFLPESSIIDILLWLGICGYGLNRVNL